MDRKTLKAKIAAIAKAIKTTTADIQIAAVECVIHAHLHGDVTLADDLVQAATKAIRRQSLVTWFERNGPFVYKGDKFKLDTKRRDKDCVENDTREALMARPWQEAVPEPKLSSVFDCSAELERFFKRIDKLADEGKVELRNLEILEAVRSAKARADDLATLRRIKAAEPEEYAEVFGVEPVVHGQIMPEGVMHLSQ